MHKRLSDVLSHVLTCSLVLTLAMPAPGMAEEVVETAQAGETPEAVEGDVPEGEATEAETEAQPEPTDGAEQQGEATDDTTPAEPADEGLEVLDGTTTDEPAVLDGEAEAAAEESSDKVKTEAEAPKAEEKKQDAKKSETLLSAQSQMTPTKEADSLASKHANTLPNGTYSLMSSYAGKYLDMKYATKADGGAAIIWNQKNVSNQRWVIANAGGGYVTIKSESSGKYLQAGYKGKDTSVVQMSRNSSERGQLWIVCAESGTYKFVSAKHTNCSLSVYGSSVVCSPDERGGNTNTRWRVRIGASQLNSLAQAHRGDLVNGTYIFRNAAKTSLALDVRYSSHDNAAAVLLRTKEGTTSQSWTVQQDSNGYVVLVNANSGRALDVKYGTAVAGTQLIQWTKKEGTPRNQRWIAIKQGNNYTFISAMDGDVLGMGPKGTSSGSSLQLVQKSNATSQLWSIEKAPSSYAKVQHIADGQYVMRSALDTGKTLDVLRSSVEPNASVKLWSLKCSDNQIWLATHDSYGHVYLRNKHSGLYLAYRNNRLVQSPYGSAWIFEKISGSTYFVKDADTGKCLDVKQNNTNLSTNEIILWGKKGGKNQQWWMSTPTIGIDTQIMGTAQVSQEAAVRYVNKRLKQLGNKSLPAKWRNDGETVAKIVKYFYEEGAAEGVRGDVALAQSIHETACFQFGGDVIPSQYNFAGIGTTGGGVRGNYFANARIGVRAQIQHLKAYASTLPLNRTCVDPRFRLVTRGRAPTIRGLSGTWAIDSSYARSLVNYLNEMLKA